MALEIAQRIANNVADRRTDLQHYQYGDRPIPEPVIKELNAGTPHRAVVTRNVYGALVLNTTDMMFIDIDSPAEKPAPTSILSSLMSLFAKKPQPVVQMPTDPAEERIAQLGESLGLSLRLYKTAAGYRAIVTNVPQNATAESCQALLQNFGADPLYIRLCKQQESFRARLTPKPWRMKKWEPPVTYPFQTPHEQQRFDRWNAEYTTASERFATCRFIEAIGDTQAAPGFQELIDFHDAQTKAGLSLPLA